MRGALVLGAVFLGALVPAPGAPADDEPSSIAAAGKGKPKKCKKGQVRVKSGRRSFCLRLPKGKATITPRAEDPRLATIKEGLTPAIVGAPDPKDQLPPPMEKVYRSFGPQALAGMETVGGLPPMLDIETFACAPEASEFEGRHFQWPAAFGFFTPTPYTSPDGIAYADAVTNEQGLLKVDESWSFVGKS